jgi:protein AroM
MNIGFITIGQSPRLDVLDDIISIFKTEHTTIHECGALDSLSLAEIMTLSPKNKDDYVLVTRLKDGKEVTVTRSGIIKHLQNCINELEIYNDIIVLLCTGEFPELKSKKLFIEPSVLLYNVVKSIASPENKIGILVPSPLQVNELSEKWKDFKNIKVYPISPYSSKIENFSSLAEKMDAYDLIIMDCIGYSIKMKNAIKEKWNKPIILPRLLVADILNELIR